MSAKDDAEALHTLLASPWQSVGRTQATFDIADPILSAAGMPLKKSRRTVTELEAWTLLVEVAGRISFGQTVTGTHREYLLAVLRHLIDGKTKTVREATTFTKGKGKSSGMVRTESGWTSDPEYITDENVALEINARMNGRCEGLPPCSHAEAVAWVADELRKDVSHIAKREAAYWKVWGVARSRGRPKKSAP